MDRKLGLLPPDRRFAGAWLHDYLAPATPPPDSTDYASKAQASMSQFYGNDGWGDCVIAGKFHAVGNWTANESGEAAVGTTAEAVAQYHQICGRGDPGCMIRRVLDHFKSDGLTIGGVVYKIDDYVGVDHTNADLLKFAIYLFGAVTIGMDLPNAWYQARPGDVWDVTNTRIVGGHDVTLVDYNAKGPIVSSWGALHQMTWAAATSRSWITEAYALLSASWYAKAGLAPCGLDVAALKADLDLIGQGQAPVIRPTPPPWSYTDQV